MSIYTILSNQRVQANYKFQRINLEARLVQFVERLLHRYQPLADFYELAGIQSKRRAYKGRRQVPLAQIQGSVSRTDDFDRRFRPLRSHLRGRWVNIRLLLTNAWEPVLLYKVGEIYYVADGHHRISVAQAIGMQGIWADVWEYTPQARFTRAKSLSSAPVHSPCTCKGTMLRI
jgi:hypothetical protein